MRGGGNRSPRGAETPHVLASILRTAHERGVDGTNVLATCFGRRCRSSHRMSTHGRLGKLTR
jgi:hypothetical protein